MFTITSIRHAWPEPAGFCLNRPNGYMNYSFVHFHNPVEIYLNGESHLAASHACIIYRPDTPQHFISHRPLVHDWFHFDGIPEPLLKKLGIPLDTLFYPQDYDFITPSIQRMEREFFARKIGCEELISSSVTELFVELSRSLYAETSSLSDASTLERLRSLRTLVFQDLGHPWTVSEMAAHIPLSESRFHSVYRSFYGTSPMEDLILARIESAQNALLFTKRPVSDIAESLGYCNLTHFSRQFRQFVGISPAQFRKIQTK